MLKVNCRVGDLAITVQAYNPENIGKIVRIIGSKGIGPWPDLAGAQQVWFVESATPGVTLKYTILDIPFYELQGEAPDCFLKPIRPPENDISTKKITEEELEYV